MTEEQVQPALEKVGGLEQPVATREELLESEVAALKQQLSISAQKYRALILAGAPEIPEELVRGETLEEIEASFRVAKEVVERVRRQLEARAAAERVPTGAPARSSPDLSALTPMEKIAYGLTKK